LASTIADSKILDDGSGLDTDRAAPVCVIQTLRDPHPCERLRILLATAQAAIECFLVLLIAAVIIVAVAVCVLLFLFLVLLLLLGLDRGCVRILSIIEGAEARNTAAAQVPVPTVHAPDQLAVDSGRDRERVRLFGVDLYHFQHGK
jgi:hypothetical protein